MTSIDIVHKQIIHLGVLLIELIKQGIKFKSENKIEREQKQKLLLSQATSVLGWAHKFDPQNINVKDFYLPPDLMDLYSYSDALIKKLPDFLAETIDHRLKQASQKQLYQRIRANAHNRSVIVNSVDDLKLQSQDNFVLAQLSESSVSRTQASQRSVVAKPRLKIKALPDKLTVRYPETTRNGPFKQ